MREWFGWGQALEAARSDKKTCSDACRARKSRKKRDPEIGSEQRRRNKLDGLNRKYAYRRRGQARNELKKLGLVPSEWYPESNEPARFVKATYDPTLWCR